MTMKTLIYALLITMSLACGDDGMQPHDPGQSIADGAPGQTQPDAAQGPASDAMRTAIDAAPVMPMDTEYPCMDMPLLNYYDNMGRNSQRLRHRYADLGSTRPRGTILACDDIGDIPVWGGWSECDGAMAVCWEAVSEWPTRACQETLALLTNNGRYLVSCGYHHEADPDFDGVFETINQYSYTIRVTG